MNEKKGPHPLDGLDPAGGFTSLYRLSLAKGEAMHGDNPEAAMLLIINAAEALKRNRKPVETLTETDLALDYIHWSLTRIISGMDADAALGLKPPKGKRPRNMTNNTRLRDMVLAHEVRELVATGLHPYQSKGNPNTKSACAIIAEKYEIDMTVVEEAFRKF